MKLKLVVLILIVLSAGISQIQGEELSKEKYISYADFLYNSADFLRASYEYLRIFHLYKNSNREKESLSFKIGNCFQNLAEFKKARKYFQQCLELGVDKGISQRSVNHIGYGMFMENDYKGSVDYLQDHINESSLIRNSIILGNILCQLNYKKAQEQLTLFDKKGYKYFKNLKVFTTALGKVKYKSPVKAGILSALVPGLGKVYSKRVTEGILSFISFCSSAYLAYEGFREDGAKSFQGWIFSSISAFLYAGNIYGAVLSANNHNQKIKLEFKRGVQLSISLLLKRR